MDLKSKFDQQSLGDRQSTLTYAELLELCTRLKSELEALRKYVEERRSLYSFGSIALEFYTDILNRLPK